MPGSVRGAASNRRPYRDAANANESQGDKTPAGLCTGESCSVLAVSSRLSSRQQAQGRVFQPIRCIGSYSRRRSCSGWHRRSTAFFRREQQRGGCYLVHLAEPAGRQRPDRRWRPPSAKHAAADCGLARARLAHQRQSLPLLPCSSSNETWFHRPHHGLGARDREVLDQVADAQDRHGSALHREMTAHEVAGPELAQARVLAPAPALHAHAAVGEGAAGGARPHLLARLVLAQPVTAQPLAVRAPVAGSLYHVLSRRDRYRKGDTPVAILVAGADRLDRAEIRRLAERAANWTFAALSRVIRAEGRGDDRQDGPAPKQRRCPSKAGNSTGDCLRHRSDRSGGASPAIS